VQLENSDTGVKTSVKTDSNGGYRFGNVIVGRYSITASAPGFTYDPGSLSVSKACPAPCR